MPSPTKFFRGPLHRAALGFASFRSFASFASFAAGGALCMASACSDSGTQNPAASSALNSGVLQLGFVGSLTGADSAVGIQAQAGAELAVARLNAYGGVLGQQVRLVEIDDASDPTKTTDAVNKLLSDGVMLGIGPTSDTAAVAVNGVMTSGKVVYISPSVSSPAIDIAAGTSLTSISPVLLRTTATSNHLASAMVQRAKSASASVIANQCFNTLVLYENDAYGTTIEATLVKLLKQQNIGVPTPIALSADPNDPNLPGTASSAAEGILKFVSTSAPLSTACQIVVAQAAVGGSYMLAYSKAIAGLAAVGGSWTDVKTYGSDGFRDPAFITAGRVDPTQTTSASAGNGSFAIAADTAPTPDETTNETTQFTSFKELFAGAHPSEDIGRYATTAYDAVMMMAIGVSRAGGATDLDSIRNQAFINSQGVTTVSAIDMEDFFTKLASSATLDYVGASGRVDFQRTGGVLNDYSVWQVVDGAYKWVQTYQASDVN